MTAFTGLPRLLSLTHTPTTAEVEEEMPRIPPVTDGVLFFGTDRRLHAQVVVDGEQRGSRALLHCARMEIDWRGSLPIHATQMEPHC